MRYLVFDTSDKKITAHVFEYSDQAEEFSSGLTDRANIAFGPYEVPENFTNTDAEEIKKLVGDVREFYLARGRM